MSIDVLAHAIRVTHRLEKYDPGHEPDGNPDEVIEGVSWHRLDDKRTEITDPTEIAKLEAGLGEENSNGTD